MPRSKAEHKIPAKISSTTKKRTRVEASEIPDKYVMQQAEEFLDSLKISKSRPPSSKSVLQLLIASLLISARIREGVSLKTFLLLKEKYDGCDLEKLSSASWSDLCEVYRCNCIPKVIDYG